MLTPTNISQEELKAEDGDEESKINSITAASVLANKGVTNHGEYFRSRLKELVLSNLQFIGDSESNKRFCIGKFFYIFNKFCGLETLTL